MKKVYTAKVTTCFYPSFPLIDFLLQGPKREIFVAGIFTEIRPVWVDDLETMPKNLKSLCLGPYITLYFLGFLF
jgi:hypothetical protein